MEKGQKFRKERLSSNGVVTSYKVERPLDTLDLLILTLRVKNPLMTHNEMLKTEKLKGMSKSGLRQRIANPIFQQVLERRLEIALKGLEALDNKAIQRLDEALDATIEPTTDDIRTRVSVAEFILQPHVNKSKVTIRNEGNVSDMTPAEIKTLLDDAKKVDDGQTK